MIRPVHRLLLLLILAFAIAPTSSAQVQTGTPPFGSFSGGPDVINLGNLNAHLTIPVLHKSGRGLNFAFDVDYDSSVWVPVTSSGTTSWQPVGAWGWTSSAFKIGYITRLVTTQQSTCYNKSGVKVTFTIFYYSHWTYVDGFGTSHLFPGTSSYAVACGSVSNSGFTATATDSSGYTLTTLGGNAAKLYAADGALIAAPLGSNAGSGNATDRNGNQIIYNSGTGAFTDTLGATPLTEAGSAPNPVTYSYQAPSGAAATFTVRFTSSLIRTNFGCSNVGDYGTNGTTSANLVTEIDLPDGSKYSFTYESTPDYSGFVTGRLASVTLPTGGTISY